MQDSNGKSKIRQANSKATEGVDGKVKKDEVLAQLESIKKQSQINMEYSRVGLPWADDAIALEYAINKVKKDKSYIESYWQGAWHMLLLIFLVKVIDVLMTIFWG